MPSSSLSAKGGSSSKMGSQAGRRKVPASPTLSSAGNPLPPPGPAPIKRIKLSLRQSAGGSSSSSGTAMPYPPPKRKVGRPRKSEYALYQQSSQQQPVLAPRHRSAPRASSRPKRAERESDGDSSDLTPPEDGDDDEDVDMTPRRRSVGRPKSIDKGKGKAITAAGSAAKRASLGTAAGTSPANTKVTVSGPAGRERRRAVKLEDAGRRRARDAKFDVTEDAFAGSIGPSTAFHIRSFLDSDSGSSFGDDESDQLHAADTGLPEGAGYGSDGEHKETKGLPEAFAGQEIEDLAYGAYGAYVSGQGEVELEREALAGWFEEEDEEMFISHLSGSEADQQSQSSAHGSPGPSEPDSSTSESEAEDELDEFGFPVIPLAASHIDSETPLNEEQPGLVLIENWDGKLELYQTKAPRPRRTGSRGSRTNGSVAGSTIAPSDMQDNGDLHLMIDPEAMADFDSTSSDEWSGDSDEMDGDTTDSMDEDDMPMLDSPAMQVLIDQQTRMMSPDPADGLIGEPLAAMVLASTPSSEIMAAPSIVVTDTTLPDIDEESPILTSASALAGGTAPQTPGNHPVMGTFLPTCTDPAQHAVIDGSKTSTTSPFTHRRRSRKNRADSVSSVGNRSVRSSTVGATSTIGYPASTDRKRRSQLLPHPSDPFASPSTFRIPPTPVISKKARYTSIPGHPKFLAAQAQRRAEQGDDDDDDDGGECTSEEGEIDLEDMLNPALLHELAVGGATSGSNGTAFVDQEHMRHLMRFDRVPVSAYIKRNFGERERYGQKKHGGHAHGHGHGHGHGYGHGHGRHGASSPVRQAGNLGVLLNGEVVGLTR